MFEDRFEILTVHVVRDGSDRVNPVETRHYRLVPVEQQWVEVQP